MSVDASLIDLLPEDDLALASVLKSPLFGLDDKDLFGIAWQRKGSATNGRCPSRWCACRRAPRC